MTKLAIKIVPGMKFNKLTAIEDVGRKYPDGSRRWKCVCDCGNVTTVRSDRLRNGHTKSCGCIKANNNRIHGDSGLRVYRIWLSMNQRCSDENCRGYQYYGSRGISVCEEWAHNFSVFKNWAMTHGYSDSLTIDRINNDGNYEPGNCRWVTMSVQNASRRKYSKKSRPTRCNAWTANGIKSPVV